MHAEVKITLKPILFLAFRRIWPWRMCRTRAWTFGVRVISSFKESLQTFLMLFDFHLGIKNEILCQLLQKAKRICNTFDMFTNKVAKLFACTAWLAPLTLAHLDVVEFPIWKALHHSVCAPPKKRLRIPRIGKRFLSKPSNALRPFFWLNL